MTLKQFKNDPIFKNNYIKIRVCKKNALGFLVYYTPFAMCFWQNIDHLPFLDKYINYNIISIFATPKCLLVDIYK